LSLSSLFLWVILGAIALYAVYAIIRWREKSESRVNKMRKKDNMNYSANIGTIMVAIIILIVALPKNGVLMDYRLDYCNDQDKIEEGFQVSGDIDYTDHLLSTDPAYINHEGFYACEIGFINANVRIIIDLLTDSYCALPNMDYGVASWCSLNFLILNKDNYQNFVSGDNYGLSSTALIPLAKTWDGQGTSTAYAENVPLVYDTYYFVMNWEYRTSYGETYYDSESLSRDYGSAYTSNNNEGDFNFYYALDIDYTEDNLKGNL